MEGHLKFPGIPAIRWSFLLVVGLLSTASWALEIPPGPYANLKSEDFKTREAAQEELLKWARERSELAIEEFFLRSRNADDPEVRERCLAVLRELVIEANGEGYIGIRMQDEFATVPDDARARGVIRVTEIKPDSGAQEAGIQLNDLIVSLNGKVWHQEPSSVAFGELIRKMKPGQKAKLKVLRADKLMDVEVKLGRRPFYADTPYFFDLDVDLDSLEESLKQSFFKQWLDRKKSEN